MGTRGGGFERKVSLVDKETSRTAEPSVSDRVAGGDSREAGAVGEEKTVIR